MQHLITLPLESFQPGCGLLPGGILAVTLFCFLKSDCPALPTSWPERGPALCPGEDSLSFALIFLLCICPLLSRCSSARSPACWLSSMASIQIPQPSLGALPPWPRLCTTGLISFVPSWACLSLLGCVPSDSFPFISHPKFIHGDWMSVPLTPQECVPCSGDSQSCRNLSPPVKLYLWLWAEVQLP